MSVPLIDVGAYMNGTPAQRQKVIAELQVACRTHGFFYVCNHGVPSELVDAVETHSRAFFRRPLAEKMAIEMAKGGAAWRGYFPVGSELTSGKPDMKEGIYFGSELPRDHPLVAAGTPLHGPNLFPEHPAELKETVLAYIDATSRLGHTLMEMVSLSLGLPATYFAERWTADPLLLFRIFNYPSDHAHQAALAAGEVPASETRWAVGEHTDYGLLTLLRQDDTGGLQVKHPTAGWIEAPPIPHTLVCNLGDVLERASGGIYKSTPHRVLNVSGRDRLSFPLFFDPNFGAEIGLVEGIDLARGRGETGDGAAAAAAPSVPAFDPAADKASRWDGACVHEFTGSYGDYLLAKVSKVFPLLKKAVL